MKELKYNQNKTTNDFIYFFEFYILNIVVGLKGF